ncbi:Phospholipase/carboxylesterase/thioesterase [Penicillium daleae]|uniref:Phospholipase/carboxylesterase/thioesterase n=1 Tax=Penicillium daleae TaxID=63821 RepID=A0AAD6G1I3_9EURO|nr:Phospholipase/carboxylesterase/thioesterase [Penicillium daleae]KAJ5449757.1 Phospholipase/carboxylesterase/thioesterase [Penicillium daleae]
MARKPYPTPLVIPPLRGEHTHTIISLHGRGSNAERYGYELLKSANLQARLPTVEFIFPTARKRRSTILKRTPINQWFDNYSLEDPGQRTELQIEGLCETAEFIHDFGRRGLWKGHPVGACAACIFTLLGGYDDSDEEKTLGAFIGLSGWLPFEQQLRDILRCHDNPIFSQDDHPETQSDDSDTEDDEVSEEETDSDEEPDVHADAFSDKSDDDLFQRSSSSHDNFDVFEKGEEEAAPLVVQAVNHIRDILDLPMISADEGSSQNELSAKGLHHLQTPVFLGHGSKDPKVSVNLGEKMSHVLSTGLGMDVTWKAYEGLGHWYRVEDEIQDILNFLQSHVGLPVEPEVSLPKAEGETM